MVKGRAWEAVVRFNSQWWGAWWVEAMPVLSTKVVERASVILRVSARRQVVKELPEMHPLVSEFLGDRLILLYIKLTL